MNIQFLQDLIHSELYDWNGLVRIMGENPELINDIPPYQEQLEILKQALEDNSTLIRQGLFNWELVHNSSPYQIYIDSNKVVLLKDYCHKDMEFDFFWLVQGFPKYLYDEKGKFILLYSLEEKEKELHIFPEWFSLFAFGENYEKFFAIPALYSVLTKNNLSVTDCNETALYRAQTYGIRTNEQIQKLSLAHSEFIRMNKKN